MAEEQACLVRARSDSESSSKTGFGAICHKNMTYTEGRMAGTEGSGEPGHVQPPTAETGISTADTDSGELIEYNETSVLAQFHEDALKQGGCGISQLRVILSCSLAMMASYLELAAIPFVLPSAEIELCIRPHEKNWLISISILGLCLGGAGYGALGGRAGRRRALLAALAVNALFATIAALMPTYGTAMCARFCSAIGSGGIIPTAFTYVAETCPRSKRHLALSPLLAAMALGALYAVKVAEAIVPDTGVETLIENKEHFSAWHRYLLLCTLPILAALISLILTQESPRFLLEVGREVDAMLLYQNIHSSNQSSICGKNKRGSNRDSDYRLSELQLPDKRQRSHVDHGVKVFYQAICKVFSPSYRRATLILTLILLFTLSLKFYLIAYTPTVILKLENERLQVKKLVVTNVILENEMYNNTLENKEYVNVTFNRCVFRDMFMSHVTFTNCSFFNTTFMNIKTSYVAFKGSLFVRSTIIDTDIEARREMDADCVLNATSIRGVDAPCPRDLTFRLEPLYEEHTATSIAMLVAAFIALLPATYRPTTMLGVCCMLVSPALYFVDTEHGLYIVEALFRVLLMLIFYGTTVALVETYPADVRCTAHGLMMSVAYIGVLVFRTLGDLGPSAITSCVIASVVSAVIASLAIHVEPSHTWLM